MSASAKVELIWARLTSKQKSEIAPIFVDLQDELTQLESQITRAMDALFPEGWEAEDAERLGEIVEGMCDDLERFQTLQHRIGIWGEETFGSFQRREGVFAHLLREVDELGQSLPDIDPDELADCAIILMELSHIAGVNLFDEVEKKHVINLGREWGPPQPDGAVLHIKNEDS